jgi:hypothetical protein
VGYIVGTRTLEPRDFIDAEGCSPVRRARGGSLLRCRFRCVGEGPNQDSPNGITAMNATALMFELVSLIADRKR